MQTYLAAAGTFCEKLSVRGQACQALPKRISGQLKRNSNAFHGASAPVFALRGQIKVCL